MAESGETGWNFYESKGLIWADPGKQRKGLCEALADGISSLAPRSEPPALSTYWIDHALRAGDLEAGSVVTGGNSTVLVRIAEGVRAEALYETFAPEEIDLDEFLAGLRTWREQVVSNMPRELPDQAPYQRNPHE